MKGSNFQFGDDTTIMDCSVNIVPIAEGTQHVLNYVAEL